jgi:hypothetical protein
MDVEHAVEVVKDLVFRPGWTLDAVYLSGDRVLVTTTVETVDTDREFAPGGYRQPKIVTPDVIVRVAEMAEDDDLIYAILRSYRDFHEHEDREFMRRRSQEYDAPFHPHRDEGDRRWETAQVWVMFKKLAGAIR